MTEEMWNKEVVPAIRRQIYARLGVEQINESETELDRAIRVRDTIIEQQKADNERMASALASECGKRRELESKVESLEALIETMKAQQDTGFETNGPEVKYL